VEVRKGDDRTMSSFGSRHFRYCRQSEVFGEHGEFSSKFFELDYLVNDIWSDPA
jgi:hypothetical protein